MEYALIKDNVVVSRIVGDKAFADQQAILLGCIVSNDDQAQIGFTLENGVFVDKRPAPEVVDAGEALNPAFLTLLDKLEEKGTLNTQDKSDIIGTKRAKG
jgi:hypothetical protein